MESEWKPVPPGTEVYRVPLVRGDRITVERQNGDLTVLLAAEGFQDWIRLKITYAIGQSFAIPARPDGRGGFEYWTEIEE